jgi:hypothetical protein
MAVPLRKAVLEETCLAWRIDLASCFYLVSRASKLTINQLTWPMLMIRLVSLFGLALAHAYQGIALGVFGVVNPTLPQVALWGP